MFLTIAKRIEAKYLNQYEILKTTEWYRSSFIGMQFDILYDRGIYHLIGLVKSIAETGLVKIYRRNRFSKNISPK